MSALSAIFYEEGDFYAIAVSYGFDVYQRKGVAAERVARIGFKGQIGLDRIKAEIARRISNPKN